MKYHIEKNTVQETLVIPLYGRKMCSELCLRQRHVQNLQP